jgi:uncharacterized protein YraI
MKRHQSYLKTMLLVLTILCSLFVAPVAQSQHFMEGIVVTEESALNIRSGPGTGHPVMATINKGERLVLLNKTGDWYQVQLPDGRTGYGFHQYIQIIAANLTDQQAGNVKLGMSVDALYTHYSREQIQLTDLAVEGMFTPALDIYTTLDARQKPAITTEIAWGNDWIISRITVHDSQFRTDCGIGVGSTLGALKRCYTLDWAGFGEGPLYVGVKEVAMSFAFHGDDIPPKWLRSSDPYSLPEYLPIMSIVLH